MSDKFLNTLSGVHVVHYSDLSPEEKLINLWNNIVREGFGYLPSMLGDSYVPNAILVDLDSCLSILTSSPLPESKEEKIVIIRNTAESIARFLDQWKNLSQVYIYHSFKPTTAFSRCIPDWDIKRNARLTPEIQEIIQTQLIGRLKRIELKNIHLVECNDSPIISIKKDIPLYTTEDGEDCLVVSRDVHYQCLFYHYRYMSLYNGRQVLDKESFGKMPGYPQVSYRMLPYYYCLVGLERHNFKGKLRVGPQKATKYVNDNIIDIYKGNNETFNEEPLRSYLKVLLLQEY